MTSLIRAVALQGYESAARSVGVDPLAAIQCVDLPLDALVSVDNFVSTHGFIRLLEHTAHAGKCPDFGLRLAQHQEAFMEGPLTLSLRHADSLNEALSIGAQYGYVFSPAMRFTLVPVPGKPQSIDLTFIIETGPLTEYGQMVEYLLSSVVNALRWISEDKIEPLVVLMPHARKSTSENYAKHLGLECRFGAAFAAVRMNISDLSSQLPQRNPLLLKMAINYIEQNFGTPEHVITERVRILLKQRMATGKTSQSEIAQGLSMNAKTLQRRLLREGQRFDILQDEVRRERFLELLKHSTRPSLVQIALMVGYAEQSALTRSCQRWFGCSPTEIRHGQVDAG